MNNEFSREPVPLEHANRSPGTLALIMIGMLLGVPQMILSGTIGRNYGLQGAILVIITGCGLTAIVAMLTAVAGARTRLSTALLSEQAFGHKGARVLTAALALALIGWIAVTIGFIGEFAVDGIQRALAVDASLTVSIISAALVITLVTIFGFALIARAPLILIPLLGLLLIFVAVTALPKLEATAPVSTVAVPFGTGVSAIVGAFIIGCVVQPDYSRFIRRPRDAMIAIAVALGPIRMLTMGCYAAAGLVTRSSDPAQMLIMLGMPAALTMLLPLGLAQNGIVTLYSSALVNATWWRRMSFPWVVIVTSALSTLIAIAGVQTSYVSFLVLLGMVFPPAAAILVQEALFGTLKSTAVHWPNLAIWCAGAVVAAFSEYGTGLTGISALDGFIAASVFAYLAIRWRRKACVQGGPSNR